MPFFLLYCNTMQTLCGCVWLWVCGGGGGGGGFEDTVLKIKRLELGLGVRIVHSI